MLATKLHNQIKYFWLIIFGLTFLTHAYAQTNNSISAERLKRIDTVMNDYIEKEKLSGTVVYISRNGKNIYHNAFGWRDKETGSPMNKDSMFRIASQTKALTSVGIMILQEQGKLLISDPVGKYLPEYLKTTVAESNGNGGYKVIPAKRVITIRDLLTHTAGIDYGLGTAQDKWKEAGIQGWYFADRNEPIRETVRRIAALPQHSQPGEAFVYGYNTDILGAVIEVVSGQSLDRFIKDNITDPLKMNDTQFYVPSDKIDRVAKVYSLKGSKITAAANPGQLEGGAHIGQGHYIEGPKKSFSGGAGLISTAKDYGTFLQMILNGGSLNGTRILSPKSVELMTQNHISHIKDYGDGVGFGLGFEVITDLGKYGQLGSEGAYGWGGAYHSTYWVDPKEQLVVVYLTQLIPSGGLDDREKIRTLIYQAIEE